MLRRFRDIEKGEFFCVFGDTSQGGSDSNFVQFGSKTKMDIPLVLQMQYAPAAEMTPILMETLRWIYKQTGVKPVVCLERNNGGTSEMYDLIKFNGGEWVVYFMRDHNGIPNMDKPGWDTTVASRPTMLGDWLMAYNSRTVKVYDKVTQEQHQTFIVNKKGKPEAAPNTHDDAVMSCAGLWQLMQTENAPTVRERTRDKPQRMKFHV